MGAGAAGAGAGAGAGGGGWGLLVSLLLEQAERVTENATAQSRASIFWVDFMRFLGSWLVADKA